MGEDISEWGMIFPLERPYEAAYNLYIAIALLNDNSVVESLKLTPEQFESRKKWTEFFFLNGGFPWSIEVCSQTKIAIGQSKHQIKQRWYGRIYKNLIAFYRCLPCWYIFRYG